MLYPLYDSELWTKTLKNDSMKYGFNFFFQFLSYFCTLCKGIHGGIFLKNFKSIERIVDNIFKEKQKKNMPGMGITCIFSHKLTYS